MSKTVTISDDLAGRLEERRRQTGEATLDGVVEALIALSLAFEEAEIDENAGYTVDELRALIAEGEASGPPLTMTADEVSAEVRRRYAERAERNR